MQSSEYIAIYKKQNPQILYIEKTINLNSWATLILIWEEIKKPTVQPKNAYLP